jgi:hypothetical protein
MIEVLKKMYQLLLTEPHAPAVCDQLEPMLREAIAELESQEPDYWLGYGLQAHTEKPFDNATALYTHPPQRTEERNFCPRCGKRTADLTTIHTCTPPQELI